MKTRVMKGTYAGFNGAELVFEASLTAPDRFYVTVTTPQGTSERGFDGIWDSSFGRLRIIHDEKTVFGFYEGVGPATIAGQMEEGRLVFRYVEPQARGQGWFELSENGMDFAGQWCQGHHQGR